MLKEAADMSVCHHHEKCLQQARQQAEKICAQRKLRFTDSRRAVFDILWQSHKALSAAEVLQALEKTTQPPIAYRALDFLVEAGLAHYIASINAYVGCIQPQHNHTSVLFICTVCKEVNETAVDVLARQLHTVAAQQHFTPRHLYVEATGLCASCTPKPAVAIPQQSNE